MNLQRIEDYRRRRLNFVFRLLLGLTRNMEGIGPFLFFQIFKLLILYETCLSARLSKASNHVCDIHTANSCPQKVIKLSHVHAPPHLVSLYTPFLLRAGVIRRHARSLGD